jgi:hypothetical protein
VVFAGGAKAHERRAGTGRGAAGISTDGAAGLSTVRSTIDRGTGAVEDSGHVAAAANERATLNHNGAKGTGLCGR